MACNPKLPPPDTTRDVAYDLASGLPRIPVINAYSTPIIDRLSGLPGGKILASLARDSFDTAAQFHGSMSGRLDKLANTLGVGGLSGASTVVTTARGRRGQQIRDWLNTPVLLPGGVGAVSRVTPLMNTPLDKADLAGAPEGTMGALREMRDIVLGNGKFMEDSGLQIRGVKGANGWIPFKTAVDGGRMSRMLNSEGQRMFETGDPDLEAAILAANPDMPPAEVRSWMDEIKKSAVLRRSPMESARVIPVMPTHVRKGRNLVPIMETDPWVWAQRTVYTTGLRGAAVQTFGQDLDVTGSNAVGTTNPAMLKPLFGTDDVAEITERIANGELNGRVTDARALELERFVRAVNGQPISGDDSLSPGQAFMRDGLDAVMTVIKTGMLSRSAVVNLPEVLGNTCAFGGFWNMMAAIKDTFTNAEARDAVRELGAVRRDLLDTAIRPGRMMQSMAAMVRNMGGRLFLSHFVNKLNEYIAAITGLHFVKSIKANYGAPPSEMHRARLLILGYTPAQAKQILSGAAQQELLDSIPRRLVETALGTVSFQGERSVAATHPGWSRALWFSSFNQMKTNRSLRQLGLGLDAVVNRKVLSVEQRGDLTALGVLMGMQVTGSVTSAVAANLLRAFVLFGLAGLLAETERDATWELMGELMWSAFGGGPAEALVSGFASGDSAEAGVGLAVNRSVGMVSVATNLWNAVYGLGKYRDQSGWERADIWLRSMVPATSVMQTLGWSIGLLQDDKAYRAAAKSYWTWRRENELMPPKVSGSQDRGEADELARIHTKNAWELLQSGEDLSGDKMARELSLALRSRNCGQSTWRGHSWKVWTRQSQERLGRALRRH